MVVLLVWVVVGHGITGLGVDGGSAIGGG